MFFGLQETRDSLKQAFESLFEKYGKEFDDDDEIDILSLKVVKKSISKTKEGQKPRKFGYLYQKGDENISDNDSDDDKEEEDDEDVDPSTAIHLEQIINERSNILVSASVSKSKEEIENSENSQPNYNTSNMQKKPRKQNKNNTQLSFDLACLGILERETSNRLKIILDMKCPQHFEEIDRECFECSLINIIP